MKVYTAFTKEIDSPDLAIAEILEQLNLEENALKNTVGFMHLYYEFVDTGVCQAIIDALPFEVVGCVSSYTGTGEKYGDIALSVMMVTSDTDTFVTRTIEGVTSKSHDQLVDEITEICTDFCADEKPKMIMPYILSSPSFCGDDLVSIANSLPETIPFFGTVAFNMENSNHYVVGNGTVSPDLYALVAFYGNFEPKFRVASSFDFDEEFSEVAEVTDAEGSILKMINGIPAVEYLRKQGMLSSSSLGEGTGMWVVPAILTYPNGVSLVRAFLGIVKGTDYIFATGNMEKGAKITFALLDGEKTLASAEKLFGEISKANENGIMAYSCAARSWSLGAGFFAETQKIVDVSKEYERTHNKALDYCVTYSAGEICPVKGNDGKLVNVLHNYTLISCAFC